MSVYMLTVGDYDEYKVVGIFSSKESMEKFMQDYQPEEFTDYSQYWGWAERTLDPDKKTAAEESEYR